MMEEFNQQFPELVGLVLAAVGGNAVDIMLFKVVCHMWHCLLLLLLPAAAPASPPHDYAAHMAAKGWLSLLQWAHANGCPWDD